MILQKQIICRINTSCYSDIKKEKLSLLFVNLFYKHLDNIVALVDAHIIAHNVEILWGFTNDWGGQDSVLYVCYLYLYRLDCLAL